MKKSNKFSPEVRERAVRMVQEHRGEYPSLWAAIESIAPKIGCVPQTLQRMGQARPDRFRRARRHHDIRTRNR
jgi:transposase-like protein